MVDERRKEHADLSERVVRLETQLGRLVSDSESEKDTRRRVNEHFEKKLDSFNERMRKIEHSIWMAAGAVGILVLIVNIAVKHLP